MIQTQKSLSQARVVADKDKTIAKEKKSSIETLKSS